MVDKAEEGSQRDWCDLRTRRGRRSLRDERNLDYHAKEKNRRGIVEVVKDTCLDVYQRVELLQEVLGADRAGRIYQYSGPGIGHMEQLRGSSS